jgi:hypothetical protein
VRTGKVSRTADWHPMRIRWGASLFISSQAANHSLTLPADSFQFIGPPALRQGKPRTGASSATATKTGRKTRTFLVGQTTPLADGAFAPRIRFIPRPPNSAMPKTALSADLRIYRRATAVTRRNESLACAATLARYLPYPPLPPATLPLPSRRSHR